MDLQSWGLVLSLASFCSAYLQMPVSVSCPLCQPLAQRLILPSFSYHDLDPALNVRDMVVDRMSRGSQPVVMTPLITLYLQKMFTL